MDDIELLRSFAVLNRAFVSFFSAAVAKKKLSYSDGVMLANIGSRPGTTQDAIARELIIDKAAVARAVKSLEALGLVRAKRSKEDRRASSLVLTSTGRARLRHIEQLNREWIEAVTSGLTKAEHLALFEVLKKLVLRSRGLREELALVAPLELGPSAARAKR